MLRPMFDRVLVEVQEEPEKIGSLYVPDNAKNRPKAQEAIVVAVGPGRRDKKGDIIKPQVDPGDRIIFEKYSGSKIKLTGENMVIINNSDIIAVITN